jgi:hypothetical protein
MHRLRLLLPIGFVVIATLAACKKKENKPAEPTPATDPNAAAVTPPEPKPPEPVKPPEPTNTTDVDVTPARLNLEEHTEWKPVPSLPKGAQMAVLEGAPPFAEGKSFAFLLKFPKGYKVPPHTHAVTERVTVLSGSIHFGHGEKLDQKKGKHIKAAGISTMPPALMSDRAPVFDSGDDRARVRAIMRTRAADGAVAEEGESGGSHRP